MFYLSVDITEWVFELFADLIYFIQLWFITWDDIIVFNGALVGEDFSVSVLDLCIGILVVSIVLGAILRISKADKYYANRG